MTLNRLWFRCIGFRVFLSGATVDNECNCPPPFFSYEIIKIPSYSINMKVRKWSSGTPRIGKWTKCRAYYFQFILAGGNLHHPLCNSKPSIHYDYDYETYWFHIPRIEPVDGNSNRASKHHLNIVTIYPCWCFEVTFKSILVTELRLTALLYIIAIHQRICSM